MSKKSNNTLQGYKAHEDHFFHNLYTHFHNLHISTYSGFVLHGKIFIQESKFWSGSEDPDNF